MALGGENKIRRIPNRFAASDSFLRSDSSSRLQEVYFGMLPLHSHTLSSIFIPGFPFGEDTQRKTAHSDSKFAYNNIFPMPLSLARRAIRKRSFLLRLLLLVLLVLAMNAY